MTLARLGVLRVQGGMSDFQFAFALALGVAALVAIVPWLRVIRAGDERALRRALPLAATATVIVLGVVVLFSGAAIFASSL